MTTEDEQLDGITDLTDVSLSKLQVLVMDREAWCAAVHGVKTEPNSELLCSPSYQHLHKEGRTLHHVYMTQCPWYSCLENPMNIGAGWATVHGIVESRT